MAMLKFNAKSFWVLLPVAALIIVAFVVLLTMQNQDHGLNLPSHAQLGEPASESNLLIDPANGASSGKAIVPPVNLMGRWRIVSVDATTIAPAEDWLEKPAIAYVQFETDDDQILLKGYSGCNGFGGMGYVLDGQLQTPELTITQRLCTNKALAIQEAKLIRILSSPDTWKAVQQLNVTTITVGTTNTGLVQLAKLP